MMVSLRRASSAWVFPPALQLRPQVLYLVLQTLDQRIYFLICIVTITSTIGLISRV